MALTDQPRQLPAMADVHGDCQIAKNPMSKANLTVAVNSDGANFVAKLSESIGFTTQRVVREKRVVANDRAPVIHHAS